MMLGEPCVFAHVYVCKHTSEYVCLCTCMCDVCVYMCVCNRKWRCVAHRKHPIAISNHY